MATPAVTPTNAAKWFDLFKAYVSEIKAEASNNGMTLSDAFVNEQAALQANRDLESTRTKMTVSLTSFSKYTGQTAPSNFLEAFAAECRLYNISDADRMHIFPSLIQGVKGPNAQTLLRNCSDWDKMKEEFTNYFQMDRASILAELRALRCKDFDVEAYTNLFDKEAQKFTVKDKGDENQLKLIYTEALPRNIKYDMMKQRDFEDWSLSFAQQEARRLSKINNNAFASRKFDDKAGDEKKGTFGDKSGDKGGAKSAQSKSAQAKLSISQPFSFLALTCGDSKREVAGHVSTKFKVNPWESVCDHVYALHSATSLSRV